MVGASSVDCPELEHFVAALKLTHAVLSSDTRLLFWKNLCGLSINLDEVHFMLNRYYPGILLKVATAHIVRAYRRRDPGILKKLQKILSLPGRVSSEKNIYSIFTDSTIKSG